MLSGIGLTELNKFDISGIPVYCSGPTSLNISCIKIKCQIARFFLMYKFIKGHFKGLLGYYGSIKDKIASLVAQEILLVLIFVPTHSVFAFKV